MPADNLIISDDFTVGEFQQLLGERDIRVRVLEREMNKALKAYQESQDEIKRLEEKIKKLETPEVVEGKKEEWKD